MTPKCQTFSGREVELKKERNTSDRSSQIIASKPAQLRGGWKQSERGVKINLHTSKHQGGSWLAKHERTRERGESIQTDQTTSHDGESSIRAVQLRQSETSRNKHYNKNECERKRNDERDNWRSFANSYLFSQ